MPARTPLVALLLALAPTGCAISLAPVDPADAGSRSDAALRDGPAADARIACHTTDDCPAGQICNGPPGCETPWFCEADVSCLAVVSTFCDCAGQTFHSPDSCARRQYAHRSACEMPQPDAGACSPEGATCNRNGECCTGYCAQRGAPQGACAALPAGTFPCGNLTLCRAGVEYCELTYSDVPTPDSEACVPVPGPCEGQATCACVTSRPCSLGCREVDARTLAFQCPGG